MSSKNVYLYKVILRDTQTNTDVTLTDLKSLVKDIFDKNCCNNAIKLSKNDTEHIILDVIQNTDEYLFARLNKKRPNHSMQKRNYKSNEITDVLSPEEINTNGVELFTYCILGYKHGILSFVNSKGAPTEKALSNLFSIYTNKYYLETESIPNQNLIYELIKGNSPEINKIQVDIAQPDAQILQQLFGFNDEELLNTMNLNMSSLVFEVKPQFSGHLIKDATLISRLLAFLKQNKTRNKSVMLSGKSNGNERQRKYDLYEEYFKYPIEVTEYRQEDGHKIEVEKDIILSDYKSKIMGVYNNYKDVILVVSNRE